MGTSIGPSIDVSMIERRSWRLLVKTFTRAVSMHFLSISVRGIRYINFEERINSQKISVPVPIMDHVLNRAHASMGYMAAAPVPLSQRQDIGFSTGGRVGRLSHIYPLDWTILRETESSVSNFKNVFNPKNVVKARCSR